MPPSTHFDALLTTQMKTHQNMSSLSKKKVPTPHVTRNPKPDGCSRIRNSYISPLYHFNLCHSTFQTTTMKTSQIYSVAFVLLALALVSEALPAKLPGYGHPEPIGPAVYKFGYAVKDGYSNNNYGHSEARDGGNAQGSYTVLLPDGRVQKVTYTVNGDSGYVANVSYA